MNETVYIIGIGVLLEVVTFVVLYRTQRWPGRQIALLVGVAAMLIYLPWGILHWRGLDHLAIHVAFLITTPYVLGIITTYGAGAEGRSQDSERRWFHWGPAAMVGFFLVIAVVDAVIITLAEQGLSQNLAARLLPATNSGRSVASVFPGTVSHDFKEKEHQFNAYMAARAEQGQRGWQVRKGWVGEARAGRSALFRIEVTDGEARAVSGARVQGRFLRPADSRLDRPFDMVERAPGVYEVSIELAQPGAWDLVLEIERGSDRHEVRASTSLRPSTG